jgi:hypothetical protein
MKTWAEWENEQARRVKRDDDATEILGFLAFWGGIIFFTLSILAVAA